jgi:hypothetical protein
MVSVLGPHSHPPPLGYPCLTTICHSIVGNRKVSVSPRVT